jgi:ribosome-binding factor A
MGRVEEEVRRALSAIIRNDVKDDRISGMVSVTRVEVTSDLKYAKAYVSVYDTEKRRSGSIEALNHGASFIRTRLAKSVDIRRTPELTFLLDGSVEYGLKIDRLLKDANKEG